MSDSKKPPKPRRAPPKKLDANEEEDMSGEYIVTSPIVLKRLNKGCSNLMYSCEMGKATDVEQDLKLAADSVLTRDNSNRNALHYCSAQPQPSRRPAESVATVAPDLLDAPDEDGLTPLHLAVIQGNMELLRVLLAGKANVNALDNERHSVVHWATVCGEIEALRAVLGAGADISTPDINGGSPLHYAAQMCGVRYAVSCQHHSAAEAFEILELILAQPQTDVGVVDVDRRQPLLWAASSGSAKAILALVKAGASVHSSDKDGLTAIHCAASRGHTDCIDTLVNLCGSPTDLIDNNGCTALHYAVALGHIDCVALLLDLGANVNHQDLKGRTPAHCGCAKGQFETVKLLAERAAVANLWLRNVKGDLPVHEAALSGRRDLVEWLLHQKPGQVNVCSNDGRTLLHIAAEYNYSDMCKMLLDAGADVNAIYQTARQIVLTPLDCSLIRGHRATAKYLQLHGGLPAMKLRITATRSSAAAKQSVRTTTAAAPPPSMNALLRGSKKPQPGAKEAAHQRHVVGAVGAVAAATAKKIVIYVDRSTTETETSCDDKELRHIDRKLEQLLQARRRRFRNRLQRHCRAKSFDVYLRDDDDERNLDEAGDASSDEMQRSRSYAELRRSGQLLSAVAAGPSPSAARKLSPECAKCRDGVPATTPLSKKDTVRFEDDEVTKDDNVEESPVATDQQENVVNEPTQTNATNEEAINAELNAVDDQIETAGEEEKKPVEIPDQANAYETKEEGIETVAQESETKAAAPVKEGESTQKQEETDIVRIEDVTSNAAEDTVNSVVQDPPAPTVDTSNDTSAVPPENNAIENADKNETDPSENTVQGNLEDAKKDSTGEDQHTKPELSADTNEESVTDTDLSAKPEYAESFENPAATVDIAPSDQRKSSFTVLESVDSFQAKQHQQLDFDADEEPSFQVIQQLKRSDSANNPGTSSTPRRKSNELQHQPPHTTAEYGKDIDSGIEPSPRAMRTAVVSTATAVAASLASSPRLQQHRTSTASQALPSKRRVMPYLRQGGGRQCNENFTTSRKHKLNMATVASTLQKDISRYYTERKIFQHLLQLKSLQIRTGADAEASAVKRAVDEYHKSSLFARKSRADGRDGGEQEFEMVQRYPFKEYTFEKFELHLYETLKALQRMGSRNFQHLDGHYVDRRHGADRRCAGSALQCTTKTHRCMHAAHAYTGIPCAAYIPMMNHHTMPKFGFGPTTSTRNSRSGTTGTGLSSFYLPDIPNERRATTTTTTTGVAVEVTHGNNRKAIYLPTEQMDKNKRYYVTLSVKDENSNGADV